MKTFFTLFAALILTSAVGVHADELKETSIPGGSATELLNKKPEEVEKLKPRMRQATKIKMGGTCTSATGKVLSPEDMGFEACSREKTKVIRSLVTGPGAPLLGLGVKVAPETK